MKVILSLPSIYLSFTYFSSLIALVRTFRMIGNTDYDISHLCFDPDINENASAISVFGL